MKDVATEEVIAHVLQGSEWVPEIPAEARDSGGVIEEITGWGFLDVAGFVDGGGNLALMKLRIAGNDTIGDVDLFDPAGNRMRRVSIRAPGWGDGIAEKMDASTVVWQGNNATFFAVTHKAISEASRPNRVIYYVIENAVVGDPTGRRGLPYNMGNIGNPQEPGSGGATIDQIREVVNAAVNNLGNNVQRLAKNGAFDAIQASLDRGGLGQAFGNVGISGDNLASAFWQEPFASRFRKLLKDAAYEMGSENHLWGLNPAAAEPRTPDQVAQDAGQAAEKKSLWSGAPVGSGLFGAPSGPRVARARRVVGRSIEGAPAPATETPADPPPTNTRDSSPAPMVGRSLDAQPSTAAVPVDSESESPEAADLAQSGKDLL